MEGARPTTLAAAAVVDGRPFPLTLSPTACAYPTAHDRTTWLQTSRREVLQLVASHGAVLLRGWGGAAASDYSALVDALGLEDFDASCSAAPRTLVAPRVFTANEAPPEEVIPFHHEMAQCAERPDYVLFFCEEAAASGGATPIISSHLVARYLRAAHPALADRLDQHGVRYVRVLPTDDDATSPLGKSWRSTFGATREVAEAAMTRDGVCFTWLPNGDLRTVSARLPAFARYRGRPTFFNAVVAATQVLLRWGVLRGVCVVPKTARISRLAENIDVFDFELTPDEMNAIGALDRNRRFNDPGVFCEGMGLFCPIYD